MLLIVGTGVMGVCLSCDGQRWSTHLTPPVLITIEPYWQLGGAVEDWNGQSPQGLIRQCVGECVGVCVCV